MRRTWAIARLTFQEGLRMRLVLVFLIVLVFLVLRLPFAVRGDETLAGRLQNFLAYALGALSLLLSLATIFFSCATLSNELKERSLHLVVTKPVTRFQILVGKWLGVNLLNLLILVLSGAAIYGFALWIRGQPEQFVRDRYKIRDVVWTARNAARPVVPAKQIAAAAAEDVRAQIATGAIDAARERTAIQERAEELLKGWRVVPPGQPRVYLFENLAPPERADTVFQVRYKILAQPLPLDELVEVGFAFCDPDTLDLLEEPVFKTERSSQVHQFLAGAAPLLKDGRAALAVLNPYDPRRNTSLVFDGDNSLVLLYKVSSFELNFLKSLAILFMRLALLSAVGVFFSVFTSFPVACLCTLSFYVVCLGLPFWLESMGVGSEFLPKDDPLGRLGPLLRSLLAPFMRAAFPDFTHYDGTNRLIEGEYLPWPLLGRAALHTLVYGAALLLIPGWYIFRTREVAEVQV